MDVVGFPQEGGFPAEAHRSTAGLRWGLLRRVRYGAVDAGRGVFRDVVGFPQAGGFPAEAHRSTVGGMWWVFRLQLVAIVVCRPSNNLSH